MIIGQIIKPRCLLAERVLEQRLPHIRPPRRIIPYPRLSSGAQKFVLPVLTILGHTGERQAVTWLFHQLDQSLIFPVTQANRLKPCNDDSLWS
jgi:hypothetical protein